MTAATPQPMAFAAPAPLAGRITVPGDKSISHRAVMLAALADGTSTIAGLLEGEDVLATAAAMRALGAKVTRGGDGAWAIDGVAGAPCEPATILDMANSGTSTRLLMGLLASHALVARFAGDASLSRRPMNRVIAPLSAMGAVIDAAPGGRLPLVLRGAAPARAIDYRLPVASAQVKSAVLLAGLNTRGVTRVIEPVATRDHSERMLAGFGATIEIGEVDGERSIAVHGGGALRPQHIAVPGDPSSAAFPLVAALLVPGSCVTVTNVGINPTRAGLFDLLRMMGADLVLTDHREVGGEPVADITARHGPLAGIDAPSELAPSMIDEYPILFVAAALAGGRSILRGLGELRVKESDRIAVMAAGLRACGVVVEELPDGLVIDGRDGDPLPGGATVASRLDHRVAMSFAVAGLVSRAPVTIDDFAPVATSFPGFTALMRAIGAVAT